MVTVTVTAGIKISITITPIPMGEQIPYQDLPQLQNSMSSSLPVAIRFQNRCDCLFDKCYNLNSFSEATAESSASSNGWLREKGESVILQTRKLSDVLKAVSSVFVDASMIITIMQ
ncbi:unnamed protein product, partial [Fusarium graminearum]